MVDVDVLAIKKQIESTVMNIPGVSGFGASSSKHYLNIYVEQINEDILNVIPASIAGIQTRIFESGRFTSLMTPRTVKTRPLQMGMSIGLLNSTTGTAGAVCYDNQTGATCILSNCHVLANSDGRNNNFAERGMTIISPGSYDGGGASDAIGTLEHWVELDEIGPNRTDGAVALVMDVSSVSDIIADLGMIDHVLTITHSGMVVKKSGRTTGVTAGTVIDSNATIKVHYPGYADPITFEDIIIVSYFAAGGDSGSLVLTERMGAVGLLFAGTSTLTAVCKIKNVMDDLGINFNIPVVESEDVVPPSPTQPEEQGNSALPLVLIGGVLLLPTVL